MKRALLLLAMLAAAGLARADDQTQAVQQALKDQGFYYGTVDGQGGAETDAAIRRYQIRQGLEVTGKLDAQTLASLNLGGNANPGANAPDSAPPPPSAGDAQPAESQAPTPDMVRSDHEILQTQPEAATPAPQPGDDTPRQQQQTQPPEQPQPPQPPEEAPPLQPFVEKPVPPAAPAGSDYSFFFRKTPYENAPPVVQRSTVQHAQLRLARHQFYRGDADGELSDSLSRGLAAYQRYADLRVTGRLDMDTLADMNLLPVRRPLAGPPPPPPDQGPRPVYRGIWVQ